MICVLWPHSDLCLITSGFDLSQLRILVTRSMEIKRKFVSCSVFVLLDVRWHYNRKKAKKEIFPRILLMLYKNEKIITLSNNLQK